MKRSFFTVILLSALVGCQGPFMNGQGPFMNGGFYQSPYRANGVDGPGPGVIPDHYQPVSLTMHDMMGSPDQMSMMPPRIPTSQINFIGVESLTIRFEASEPGVFDSLPLTCPATWDFGQGAIYRLKLSNIPGHHGKELYPTLEVAATAARTRAFLEHSSVPVEFNDNDFDQVFYSGNFVTKVIFLPNPEYQGVAMSGVGTLVNTALPPGADPITEASKRGSILAVIRMGNKDMTNKQRPPGWHGQIVGQMEGQMGGAYPINGSTMPQNVIAGVNIPAYGVPMTKTTTGVPGPPQLPQDMHYGPNRHPIVRTEPIPAPPIPRTYAVPGQPIPNPYAPPPPVEVSPQS